LRGGVKRGDEEEDEWEQAGHEVISPQGWGVLQGWGCFWWVQGVRRDAGLPWERSATEPVAPREAGVARRTCLLKAGSEAG
jgi:hypothetical protein